VWDEVSAQLPAGAPPEAVDTDDIVAAVARTPDRFVLVAGPDELAQILAHPFDAWRAFLHPAQREIAYRPSYAGPALVTGGAGTGKMVTALHRAVHLARLGAGPILLTTFTRNLADALDRQLGLLADDPAVRDRIEVLNVDRLAYRVVAESLGRQPAVVDAKVLPGPDLAGGAVRHDGLVSDGPDSRCMVTVKPCNLTPCEECLDRLVRGPDNRGPVPRTGWSCPARTAGHPRCRASEVGHGERRAGASGPEDAAGEPAGGVEGRS